jgi:endonuclease/exonuclease/phosphatase family metal-dependent hydrolase
MKIPALAPAPPLDRRIGSSVYGPWSMVDGMTDRARLRVILFVAALVVGLSGCGESDVQTNTPPTLGPPPSLKVMTFNVLCSFCDPHNFDPWAQRLDDFADIFARHDPDLIGLQELSPPPLSVGMEVDQILARAPGRAAIYFAPTPSTPYPDATILYRSSRFTVLEHGQYWLSPTPDQPLSTGFAAPQLPRLVVWARLRDNARDREIYFATTHFDNNSPSQAKSAPLVQERTAPFVEREPVIVVGDFNSRPDSAAYQILTGDSSWGFVFQNAFDLTHWHIVTNQVPEPAYDVNDRIDHIFLAGQGVTWSVQDWVADLTVYGAKQRYPSDHFPIVAEVTY